METHDFGQLEARSANMVLAIAGGQWLIEALYSYFTFVRVDRLVFLVSHHHQAQKRYHQF